MRPEQPSHEAFNSTGRASTLNRTSVGADILRPDPNMSALEMASMKKKGRHEPTSERVNKRQEEIRQYEEQINNLQIEIEEKKRQVATGGQQQTLEKKDFKTPEKQSAEKKTSAPKPSESTAPVQPKSSQKNSVKKPAAQPAQN